MFWYITVQQSYAISANFLTHHVNSSAISTNETYVLDKDWLGELTDDDNDGVAVWPTCLAILGHFLMCVV